MSEIYKGGSGQRTACSFIPAGEFVAELSQDLVHG